MSDALVLPPPPPRAGGQGPRPVTWRRRLARGAGGLVTGLVAALVVGLLALAALPAVGGRLLVVTSGSMAPTIATGDAVVLVDTPAAHVAPGDVIAYTGYTTDRLVTHRVVSRHDVDGRLHFRTKGDANATPDPDLAPASGMAGRVAVVLPGAGWALALLTSRWSQLVLVGLAVTLATCEGRDLLRTTASRPRTRWSWAPSPGRSPRRDAGRAAIAIVLACVSLAIPAAVDARRASALLTSSERIAASTFATVDVQPPGNVTATAECGALGLDFWVTVEWDGVADAAGYEVARSTTVGGPYTTIATPSASTTSYQDGDVAASTMYYYVVRTVISSGWTDASVEVSADTAGLLCL